MKYTQKKKRDFWMFVLPALFFYGLFMLVPLIGTCVYSLTDWNGIAEEFHFVGIQNYFRCFQDSQYRQSLFITIKMVVIYVIAVNVLAILFAVLLESKFIRGRKIFRSIIFMPNAISLIMVAFLWKFMFTKVFNSLPDLFSFLKISWFGNGTTAMVTIIVALLWQSVGYFMVIYIAGLQSVDTTYLEAAYIDGANGRQRFFRITLPLIMPSIVVNVFVSISGAFKTFDIPFMMTQGGPGNSTSVVAYDIYKEAFLKNNVGYASAKAVLLCILVMFVTYFQIRSSKAKEVEA